MSDIPVVLTQAGRTNTPPATLLANLLSYVAAIVPGYTGNLPGSLISDIAETDVGALVVMDQAVTDLINSVTPYGANDFLLNQLGAIYGVTVGTTANTSVNVVFTGTVGFAIAIGTIVSDGTYQYLTQDAAIVGTSGSSASVYCVATQAGSWAVPAGSVTQILSSIPSTVTLTVTNPAAGVPSLATQTEEAYRAQVLQAGNVACVGTPQFLKTLLGNVSGVQANLVSVQQVTTGTAGWKVIVGGGDQYQVANAIFQAVGDISNLVASTTNITGITNANPGVVTTSINHGFTTGQTGVAISGVLGMTAANGTGYTVTVVSPTTFSFGVNTTSFGAYTSGGIVTPNTRNAVVTVLDYPDKYTVTFVQPPQQTVSITVTWNTISTNIVANAAVAQAAQPALVAYVNGIYVGQPMNLFELQATFQTAVANLIPTPLLTRMIFAVTINGVSVSPASGTGVIAGDSESYFYTTAANIVINQG